MDNNKVVLMPQQQVQSYNKEQIQLIKDMYAKNATDDELKLLMYMSNKYGLDILTRQIWCVKFGNQAAQIYAGRDGFLEIAHRSGVFNGMESGTTGSIKEGNLKGWCKVYRKDMDHPFSVEVDFEEYSTGKNLWQSKPKTMIQKVAESQCLRKAFSITGLYSPEEMGQWEEEQQRVTVKDTKDTSPKKMTKEQWNKIIELMRINGLDGDGLKEICLKTTGKGNSRELTLEDADKLIIALEELIMPKEGEENV